MTETVERAAETKSEPTSKKTVLIKAPVREVLKTLRAVSGIVVGHHTLPILANVLLVKNGVKLQMIATDMEHQIDANSELGFGEGDDKVTVGAKKLGELLKALPEDATVTLTKDGSKVTVTSGKSRFTLQTLEAEDFPLAVEAKYDTTVTMSQKSLKTLLSKVGYAMAVQDVRHYLMGMLLEVSADTLRAVATDGSRLATGFEKLEHASGERKVILHRKAVLELLRNLDDSDEKVSIHLGDSQAAFAFKDRRFLTKLVEGKYPDYNRVLPKGIKFSVTTERAMLLSALRRAELMTSEKFKAVRMTFGDCKLLMSSSNADQEEADEEIGIDYDGKTLSIGFNVKLLAEAVDSMVTDLVTLGLRTEKDSVLVTHEGFADSIAVVMPMNL